MPPRTRTIIIGFDGADARLTAVLMRAGLLPNFSALAAQGAFRHLLSTTPAESAVAWTSFTMAHNPGHTGIFDFVARSPHSYAPRLSDCHSSAQPVPPSLARRWTAAASTGLLAALAACTAASHIHPPATPAPQDTDPPTPSNKKLHAPSRRTLLKSSASLAAGLLATSALGLPLTRWLPTRTETFRSNIAGQPWWDRLATLGQRSIVLRIPLTFPAHAHPNVRLLAGLGVPDIRLTTGAYTLLTDSPNPAKTNHLPLTWHNDRCTVRIPGPDALNSSAPAFVTLHLHRLSHDTLSLTSASRSITLKKGDKSDFFPLSFPLSPLVHIRAIARFFYLPDPSATSIYITPIEFDPASPPDDNPISSPPDFARQLHADIGPYHTVGWDTQSAALSDRLIDHHAYLQDVHHALDLNTAQLLSQLHRNDWDNLMIVIQATDQAHHMLFDAPAAAMQSGSPVIPSHPLLSVYQHMDAIVGQVLSAIKNTNTRLVVMSDHGFAPFRRAVNVNTFLAQKGYLALKDKSRWDSPDASAVLASEPWSNVDWFNTRAYALGLAGVYLNVANREPAGIVKYPDEYEFLQDRLAAALMEWTDPQTSQPIFAAIHRRQDIYTGPHAPSAPDLILAYNEGYRTSSPSAVGGIPQHAITDNTTPWLADHCGTHPPLIPGLCLTSFPNTFPSPLPIHLLPSLLWPQLPQPT